MTNACEIDRDQPLDVLMRQRPGVIGVFIRRRIHCVGCSFSPFHCLRDAAALHGVDEEQLVQEVARACCRDQP